MMNFEGLDLITSDRWHKKQHEGYWRRTSSSSIMVKSLRLVGLLYNRWRHHLHNLGMSRRGRKYSPAPVVSPATIHKTFEPTELTSTYVCTRSVLGGIGNRIQDIQSGGRAQSIPVR
ncbi:hypothetical protein TNCV_102691 [Trichonephila clavipes]|nr:hypothetical protein TNCV_102691 [Trichonephila clavipes]